MKKIVLAILFSVSAIILYAQDTEAEYYPMYSIHEPRFGFTGGLHLSKFHGDEYGDASYQFGFQTGFTYNLPLGRTISFEPQLLYSKKGGELDYVYATYYTESVRYRLHYLEMPLLFNIHTNSNLDFVLGGYGSTLLDATFNVTTPNAYGYGELSYGDFEKYDLGLIGGVAFNFPFSKLSIKYSYGFKDVLKNTDIYEYLKGARNDQISISFTRYFR